MQRFWAFGWHPSAWHRRGLHNAPHTSLESWSSGNFGVNRNWNILISNSWCHRNSHKDRDIAQILAPGLQHSLSQNWQPATSTTSHFSENGTPLKKSGCHVHEPKRLIKKTDTGSYTWMIHSTSKYCKFDQENINPAYWKPHTQTRIEKNPWIFLQNVAWPGHNGSVTPATIWEPTSLEIKNGRL